MKTPTTLITYTRQITAVALAFATLAPFASAVDVIDEFDGAFLDDTKWFAQGEKSATIADGRLNWSTSTGNWGDGEIESIQTFVLPPDGETTTITWELAPVTITTDNPNNADATGRYQIGIFSNNEPANFDEFGDPAATIVRREHWPNEEGGVWYDITNIANANPTTASGGLFDANRSKVASSGATQQVWATISDWDWATESRVVRLEITNLGYVWYDGDIELGSNDWINAGNLTEKPEGITNEFDAGFRVMALVMNFDAGRAHGGLERLAIENAFVPSPTLSDFRAERTSVVAGQVNTLSWSVAPGSTVSIQPDIGDVTAQTIDGKGSITLIPVEDDVPSTTDLTYTVTVVNGAETLTRDVTVSVEPRPRLRTTDFIDEFDDGTVNPNVWESRGGKPFVVENDYYTRNVGGGSWGRHEINTIESFPLPPAGNSTIIKWNLGPSTVTTVSDDGEGRSVRHQIGIISYHERAGGSRETWNNTTGGIYLDLFFNDQNTTGITGGILWNDDQKPNANQYPWRGGVTVSDWNWLTDDHEFSLEVTAFGYTWRHGTEEIYTGTWNEDNLDNEWVNGFRVFACGMNYSTGDGTSSVQAISVDNGGEVPTFDILTVARNGGGVDLTWESAVDEASVYNVERSSGLDGTWTKIAENIASAGETTSYTDASPPAGRAFYRVTKLPPPPVFYAGFEAGEDVSGWSEELGAGSTTQWELGAPTAGPSSANTGDNVYGTKLGRPYDNNQLTTLVSPIIDLGGGEDLSVQFFHWFDIEADFDSGTLDIVDEAGAPVLLQPVTYSGSSGGWIQAIVPIPEDAPDRIRLRFEMFADPAGEGFTGWYIDDVSIR